MREVVSLLRTLLLSSSQLNVWRHSADGRVRRRAVAAAVGFGLLAVMLVGYCLALCAALSLNGAEGVIPGACALSVSVLAFVLTLFNANGYLFGLRDHDLLMSLPVKARSVVVARFYHMYVRALPWYGVLSLSMMVGHGVAARPPATAYLAWVGLSILLPIIPMLAAALVGFLVVRISVGLRLRVAVQTVLMVAVTLAFLLLQPLIEGLAEDGAVTDVLARAVDTILASSRLYPPAAWFAGAVAGSVIDGLLLVSAAALAFAATFTVVGRSFASINSELATHAARHDFRLGEQRRRGVTMALVHKEWRRLTGSAIYLTNSIIGLVMAVVLGVVALVVDFRELLVTLTQGVPLDPVAIHPAIPFAVHFLCGMVATTAASPSLEGRNYWVVRSLPIEPTRLYQAKMLFNLVLTLPPTLFANACLCLSARVDALDALLYVALGCVLCAGSSAWGCVFGIRFMRLDWEREVEVVKGGAAMGAYVVSNMVVTTVATAFALILGASWAHELIAVVALLVASACAVLGYLCAMSLARRT